LVKTEKLKGSWTRVGGFKGERTEPVSLGLEKRRSEGGTGVRRTDGKEAERTSRGVMFLEG